MLAIFDDEPATYCRHADAYYKGHRGPPTPEDAVRAVYAHEPITQALVDQLNPAVELPKLRGDLREIGYPARDG